MLRFIAVMAVGGTLASCRGQSSLSPVEAGRLTFSPTTLELPSAYVGFSTSSLTLTNTGASDLAVDLSASVPFSLPTQHLELGGYQSQPLEVTFAPLSSGQFSGVLRLGTLEVPLGGEGLELPTCAPASCLSSSFDPSIAACVDQPKPDGTACDTGCVHGTCSAGSCVGQLEACDDHDACTVDACGRTGCMHTLLQCPPSSCKVGCDPLRGCGVTDAPDGTPCGLDNCLSPTVNVCIGGACVARTRPVDSQCKNRWQLVEIEAHAKHAMVYDPNLDRVIAYGGVNDLRTLNEVWLWNGHEWAEQPAQFASGPDGTPDVALVYDAARTRTVLHSSSLGTAIVSGSELSGLGLYQSPRDRHGFAMAYDVAREKVVLFGGEGHADTWELDSDGWLQRGPLSSPPELSGHVMGYDGVRNQVLLFGGSDTSSVTNDTWVWNGTLSTWAKLHPAHSPPARTNAAMVFDSARNRLVLFGGSNDLATALADTWEWNGYDWSLQLPPQAPPARWAHALAYDSKRHEVVLFGGLGGTGSQAVALSDTWVYAGGSWQLRAGQSRRPRLNATLSWNPARASLVLFHAPFGVLPETWEWATRWSDQAPQLQPPTYWTDTLAFGWDGARSILVIGDRTVSTWAWNGEWTKLNDTGPSAKALAYDSKRKRLVAVAPPNVWEWDRSTWSRVPTSTGPSLTPLACAYDTARARVVCQGDGTWEWDGQAWQLDHPAHAPRTVTGQGLAYDATRQRVVLFGGVDVEYGFTSLDTWEWDGTDWLQRHPTVSPEFGRQSTAQLFYDDELGKVVLFDGADLWVFLPEGQ